MPLTRRSLLAAALATPALAQDGALATNALPSFDREMEAYMQPRGIPGGALAVVKDGRLIYAKGYGWADRAGQEKVQPDSLFRIASISKPITAVAVLKLVEQGKLRLEDRAFELVQLSPPPGKTPDPRLAAITIRQLLQHAGGWDRDQSFDPMFRPGLIAQELGAPAPAGPEVVVRYMLGQRLDFDPGTRFAYSNFGYCVLGRVIEELTDTPYDAYVRKNVLAPARITTMRIGASLENARAPKEVRYYSPSNATGRSVFPTAPGRLPVGYGTFNLEAMDAHGGWLASAVDLAKFAAALDDPAHSPLLVPATLKAMYERPAAPLGRKKDGTLEPSYYALGWQVRPVGDQGKANYWHSGSLPGTNTLLVRRWDGLSWAALFNQRSEGGPLPDGDIDAALHRAAADVKVWPPHDLFSKYR